MIFFTHRDVRVRFCRWRTSQWAAFTKGWASSVQTVLWAEALLNTAGCLVGCSGVQSGAGSGSTRLYDATSQKTVVFKLVAMTASDLTRTIACRRVKKVNAWEWRGHMAVLLQNGVLFCGQNTLIADPSACTKTAYDLFKSSLLESSSFHRSYGKVPCHLLVSFS